MEKFKISQPNKTEMLELVVTKEGESRQMYPLPHGGGRCQGGPELPWRSWVATRGMESKWLYSPSPWGLMVDAQPARSGRGINAA